ncbi:MAG: NosD domain-containing protein [Candidatus Bathyarchaeia archaeon]
MKNKIKTLATLLTIFFSTINVNFMTLHGKAEGTYVEGPITRDTLWTLLDSPIIIANNVTVYPGVTLTIEPGVEVKFGGPFSLFVYGKLSAVGTFEKPIIFTSNKDQKGVGNWESIIFKGAEKSTLKYCLVAGGKDAIVIENSNVDLQDSSVLYSENGMTVINGVLNIQNFTIIFCTKNGINITDSSANIQYGHVINNGENGISITGSGHVAIANVSLIGNINGILLTGASVSNVNITRSIISANTQNGVLIEAESHANINIFDNAISSNNVGFYISTSVNTYLTRNSISYNKVGALYTNGSHTAEYNDLYGNEVGMDIEANVEYPVNVIAEHNYWGDPTGPNHESLNPHGKGDKVGGNGADIDFIPYLTKPIGQINTPPTANLLTDKTWVQPNSAVMFYATNSHDEDEDGYVYQYYIDFGDESNSGWTTLSVFAHEYASPGDYNVRLWVVDDYGAISSATTATIYVRDMLQPLFVNLELSSLKTVEKGNVNVTVYVTNGTTPVADATVTLYSLVGGDFNISTGQTNEVGVFNTTFIAPFIEDDVEKDYVRIVAIASMGGVNYADSSDYEDLEIWQATGIVEPGTLAVQITPESSQTFSGTQLALTVRVMEYDMSPVEGAHVTMETSDGSLSLTYGITNVNGEVTFNFTAPIVNEQKSVTIMANATKAGYNAGQSQALITVNPYTFNIEIITPIVESGKSALVKVIVKRNEDSFFVSGANVFMQASYGTFISSTNVTGSDGTCTFTFDAPQTSTELQVIIIASVSKDGYVSASRQVTLLVVPAKAEGWTLTTWLLIIVPVIVIVIIVVLVKLKIIQISIEEGEEEGTLKE